MSRLGREIGRALKALERAEAKPSFTWKGAEVLCTANEAVSSKLFGAGGFALVADLTLFVRTENFPDDLVEKKLITYRDNEYRVDHIGNLPGDGGIKLVCNDPSKGV